MLENKVFLILRNMFILKYQPSSSSNKGVTVKKLKCFFGNFEILINGQVLIRLPGGKKNL